MASDSHARNEKQKTNFGLRTERKLATIMMNKRL